MNKVEEDPFYIKEWCGIMSSFASLIIRADRNCKISLFSQSASRMKDETWFMKSFRVLKRYAFTMNWVDGSYMREFAGVR
eukprot:7305297-Ditylum_brightwellii.AAC.1